MAGHHLKVGNLAEVRLDVSLIDEYGCRIPRIALYFATILCGGLCLGRRDGRLDRELHQPLDSDVLPA